MDPLNYFGNLLDKPEAEEVINSIRAKVPVREWHAPYSQFHDGINVAGAGHYGVTTECEKLMELANCPEQFSFSSCELLSAFFAESHIDETYSGEMFLSIVVGRGGDGGWRLKAYEPSTDMSVIDQVTLNCGDVFLLDPLSLHELVDLNSKRTEFLVVQKRLHYENEHEYKAIIKHFQPKE